jgi:hypothetical protein
LRAMSVARGATDGLWLLAGAVVVGQAVRVLAGPVGGRIDSAETYYTLLRRLPVLEVGVALAMLALVLVVSVGRARIGRRAMAGGVAAAAVLATALGGFSLLVVGAAAVAIGLSLWSSDADETPWGGWLGLIVLVLILGGLAQAVAPEAAFLFLWPGLIAALAAAITAVIGARLTSWRALLPAAVATAGVGGWLLVQGHGVFLGVGMDLPGALGLIALLVVLTARPLAPTSAGGVRVLRVLAAVCLIAGCGVALGARAMG